MLQITPSLWFPSLSTMAILRTMQQQMIDRAAQCLTHRVPGAQQAHAFIAHHHQRQRVDSWRWRAVSSCSDERSGVPMACSWEFRTQNPLSSSLTRFLGIYILYDCLGIYVGYSYEYPGTAVSYQDIQLLILICTVANSTLSSTKV